MLRSFQRVNKGLQKFELLLCTCAELYSSLVNFLSEIRHEFDQQAKANLPNINYRAVIKRQRNASDALSELFSKKRFKINYFIPMLDVLAANLRKSNAGVSNMWPSRAFCAARDVTLESYVINKQVFIFWI